MTKQLHFHFSLSCIGERNGNPLQCSCLGNPRGRGAWWAAVSGVVQSQTRLKRLSGSRAKVWWLWGKWEVTAKGDGISFLSFFFVVSSLIRTSDGTCAPALGAWSLNHWTTTRDVQWCFFWGDVTVPKSTIIMVAPSENKLKSLNCPL